MAQGQSITNAQQAAQNQEKALIAARLYKFGLDGLRELYVDGKIDRNVVDRVLAIAESDEKRTVSANKQSSGKLGNEMTVMRTGQSTVRLMGTQFNVSGVLQRGLKAGDPFLLKVLLVVMLFKLLKQLFKGQFLSENFGAATNALNTAAAKHGVEVTINSNKGHYEASFTKKGKPLSNQEYHNFMVSYNVALVNEGLKPTSVDFALADALDARTSAAVSAGGPTPGASGVAAAAAGSPAPSASGVVAAAGSPAPGASGVAAAAGSPTPGASRAAATASDLPVKGATLVSDMPGSRPMGARVGTEDLAGESSSVRERADSMSSEASGHSNPTGSAP